MKTAKKSLPAWKTLLFIASDILLILGIIFLLNSSLSSSRKLSELRSLEIKYKGLVDPGLVLADLQENYAKISDLGSVLIDEQGLIEYVRKIDELRAEGIVKKFSFVTQEPVKDKQGFTGLPVLLEFEGTGVDAEKALNKVQMLPAILKPVDIEVLDSKVEDKLIIKMSAFLYTNEEFSGN